MHKLRRAMVRPERDKLSGIVELDETMIGGITPGRGGGYGDKVAVMIAIEHNETHRLGRVRLAVADHPGTSQLVDFATTVIEPGSTIRTDGARTLRRLADLGYTHEFTLGYSAPDKASVLPGVHLVASLLKRWLIGTLHFRVEETHLPYYLDEYTFRFNRRNAKSRGLLFYRLLEQAVDTTPHPLKDLLKPEAGIPDFT
jgi:transposase-like protein